MDYRHIESIAEKYGIPSLGRKRLCAIGDLIRSPNSGSARDAVESLASIASYYEEKTPAVVTLVNGVMKAIERGRDLNDLLARIKRLEEEDKQFRHITSDVPLANDGLAEKIERHLFRDYNAALLQVQSSEIDKKMKSFNERCYALLRKVPKGKVTTYKALAEALKTKAYQAVGNAMNKNPYAPQVPCHRVINVDGRLGGFASGLKSKISLLKEEGIVIEQGKISLEKFEHKFN